MVRLYMLGRILNIVLVCGHPTTPRIRNYWSVFNIDKDYLDRLKELNLWTLEERRNRADLIEHFKIKGSQLFTLSLYLPWTAIIKAHVVTWPSQAE